MRSRTARCASTHLASRWSARALRRTERSHSLTALSVGSRGGSEHGVETFQSLGPQHFDGCPPAQGRLLGRSQSALPRGEISASAQALGEPDQQASSLSVGSVNWKAGYTYVC